MNLFVDDFRQAPVGYVLVTTIDDAKAALESGRVEKLSLDHDLGACAECVRAGRHIGDMASPETTFMNWCPHSEDGVSLVRWILETGHFPSGEILVHSRNPVGKRKMIELLGERYG